MIKEKVVATLTVMDIGGMSYQDFEDLLTWIREQAKGIRKYHKTPGFSKRYRARLYQ